MRKTLYFIRHAQSYPSRRIPDAQWPLSERGLAQAAQLPELLIPLGIEQLFSSPYLRCIQTIGPFAKTVNLDIEQRKGLHERLISKMLIEDFTSVWHQSWVDFDFALPGCESNRQAQSQFLAAVREIVRESTAETVGICAHGAVMGLLLHTITDGSGRELTDALTNPDVIRIDIDNDVWNGNRQFQIPGLIEILSHHQETPIDLD